MNALKCRFTPGPWVWVRDGTQDLPILLGADGARVCDFGTDVVGFDQTAGTPPEPADARLIAAAPPLLAEVERSAATFADLAQTFAMFGYPVAAEACRVAERANRALIAKITGESS